MTARHNRIVKLEKRNKRKLETALALLLLRSSSEDQLIYQMPFAVVSVQDAIRSMRRYAAELANQDTRTPQAAPEPTPQAVERRSDAASVSLVGALVAAVHREMVDEESFQEAAKTALEELDWSVQRISASETFGAYNRQWIANVSEDGEDPQVRWSALLDKHTCPVCESRDGKVYRLSQAPSLPAHVLCRCVYSKT